MTGRAPLWLERTLFVLAAAIASFGGVGLLLAYVGHYSLALVSPFGILGTLAGAAVALRYRRSGSTSRSEHAAAAVMCAVALGTVLWNAANAGNHVITDRDGGSYAVIGKWISEHGSLQAPIDPLWRDPDLPITASAGAVYEVGDNLQFQFSHLVPVLLAETNDVGGDGLMFKLPALLSGIALLAIYAVGRRVVREPWLLVVAVTALGIGFPQLYLARDTLSETTSQVLLWVGLLGLLAAFDRATTRSAAPVAALSGVVLGATFCTHIDAPAVFLLLPLLLAASWLRGGATARRVVLHRSGLVLAGAAAPVVLGIRDLQTRSGFYYHDLHSEAWQLYLASGFFVIVGLATVALWPRLAEARAWLLARRAMLARGIAVAIVAALLLAWAVRPFFTRRGLAPNPMVVTLEKREGLAVDPTRSFAEHTMVWLSWYVGPVLLACAILGAAMLVHRLITRPTLPVGLLLAVTGALTAIYLYNPSITPDQPWASRRFATVSLPLVAIAGAVGARAIVQRLPTWTRGQVRTGPAAALAAVAILVPVVLYTLPVRSMSASRGQLNGVRAACAQFGPDAAALFLSEAQDGGGVASVQTIMDWCGIPAARLSDPATPTTLPELHELARAWQARGRTLWLVGTNQARFAQVDPTLSPQLILHRSSGREPQRTLNRAPDGLGDQSLTLFGAPVLG